MNYKSLVTCPDFPSPLLQSQAFSLDKWTLDIEQLDNGEFYNYITGRRDNVIATAYLN